MYSIVLLESKSGGYILVQGIVVVMVGPLVMVINVVGPPTRDFMIIFVVGNHANSIFIFILVEGVS